MTIPFTKAWHEQRLAHHIGKVRRRIAYLSGELEVRNRATSGLSEDFVRQSAAMSGELKMLTTEMEVIANKYK